MKKLKGEEKDVKKISVRLKELHDLATSRYLEKHASDVDLLDYLSEEEKREYETLQERVVILVTK